MAPIAQQSSSAILRALTGLSSALQAPSSSSLRKRLLVRLVSSVPLPPSLLRSDLFRRAFATPSSSALAARQTIGFIPTSYQIEGPAPGTVVGIVLGSVGGFLLLFVLLWALTSGAVFSSESSISAEEEVVVRRRGPPSRSSHRRSRRASSIREVRQMSRSPARPSRVIVEERTERVREAAPPPPPPPAGFPRPGSVIVEERRESFRDEERRESFRDEDRRVDGDNIVEVTEERSDVLSPPRRRDSDRRRSVRRSSGYRSVDPNAYAGGNYPQRHIGRRDDDFSERS